MIPFCQLPRASCSRFEGFAAAFRGAGSAGNIAVVESTSGAGPGGPPGPGGSERRYYKRSVFVFGACIRMANSGGLRSVVYPDASWTKIKFFLTAKSAQELTVRVTTIMVMLPVPQCSAMKMLHHCPPVLLAAESCLVCGLVATCV